VEIQGITTPGVAVADATHKKRIDHGGHGEKSIIYLYQPALILTV
jgi:hypothetical protein